MPLVGLALSILQVFIFIFLQSQEAEISKKLSSKMDLTFDLCWPETNLSTVCQLEGVSFFAKAALRLLRDYTFQHPLPPPTHSHTHTLADTHQLNWVIRAIYIIIQASGCFNSVVCGNVLVGTAVHSDRRRKQDSSVIYLV